VRSRDADENAAKSVTRRPMPMPPTISSTSCRVRATSAMIGAASSVDLVGTHDLATRRPNGQVDREQLFRQAVFELVLLAGRVGELGGNVPSKTSVRSSSTGKLPAAERRQVREDDGPVGCPDLDAEEPAARHEALEIAVDRDRAGVRGMAELGADGRPM
jgi:hypothetical protein